MKKAILILIVIILQLFSIQFMIAQTYWQFNGNSSSGEWIGTTSNQPFRVQVYNSPMLEFLQNGNMAFGDYTSFTARSRIHSHENSNGNIYTQFTNTNTGAGSASTGFRLGITYVGGGHTYSLAELKQFMNAPIAISTNNIERVRFDSSGFVGIGNSDAFIAKSLVHMNQAGSTVVYSQYTNGNTTNGLKTGLAANGQAEIREEDNRPIKVFTNNTEVARFDSTGRFGIGTTTPTNILSLGNGSAQKIWIENTANTVAGRNLTVAAGGTVTAGTADMAGGELILQAGLGKGTGASTISFQNGTTGTTSSTLQTMSTKMTILGNGNVGVNTTKPYFTLEVNGITASKTFIVLNENKEINLLQEIEALKKKVNELEQLIAKIK